MGRIKHHALCIKRLLKLVHVRLQMPELIFALSHRRTQKTHDPTAEKYVYSFNMRTYVVLEGVHIKLFSVVSFRCDSI